MGSDRRRTRARTSIRGALVDVFLVAGASLWAPRPTLRDALRLSVWTLGGSLALKYGELAVGDFFFEPNYAKALAVVAVPTAAWTATVVSTTSEGEDAGFSMEKVKSFGKAGTLAYVLVELAFWALALPAAIGWYRVAEGDVVGSERSGG